MTQFKRKKSAFPHTTPMILLQCLLALGLIVWVDMAWVNGGDGGDGNTATLSQVNQEQQHAAQLRKPIAALPTPLEFPNDGADSDKEAEASPDSEEDGPDDDDKADKEQDDDGEDSDEEKDANEGEEEDSNDDAEPKNGEEEDEDKDEEDGLEKDGDEEEDVGEEKARRRLHAPINSTNGIEELESKRFVMELENLTSDNNSNGTTTGRVVIETRPAWAPIGAAHFHELVQHGFYDQCRFFRVVENFIVQFGISGDPAVEATWRKDVLKDEKAVVKTNQRGTVTYATAGPNTRTTQLFFNTRTEGNAFLDKQGFAPFAEIVEGMEWIEHINKEYGEQPNQGAIESQGNAYLNEKFPNLSYIVTLKEDEGGDSPDEATEIEDGGRP
mmetsp:Transcript_8573/g.11315  ORF Transcript_8573/g.11315 Transcript_8573/m.11315 type:complete len:385 (+) Transcript_8573:153-1307(+)|eukprot:CAMPEP_0198144480 /NCGR_PEP_ID=MMETSP1443-20131203/16236_1 /TAXON_ID=186043 /ORGANISM="Entomoneis sp., Strain CCMP2396" /LENGTH=384 /DNA_ID=CAMNT_0043807883 /DNA_START=90 /DNA_END=1244 /DNA_ORIENTATION=+